MSSWRKPQNFRVKINVKGILDRRRRVAAVGCIIRDSTGHFIRASEGVIGLADPFTADLWAIYYGLQLAWEMGLKKVVLESECELAVRYLNNPSTIPQNFPMSYLVEMIIAIKSEDWDCLLDQVNATANQAAITLAINALNGEVGMKVLREAPAMLTNIIGYDSSL